MVMTDYRFAVCPLAEHEALKARFPFALSGRQWWPFAGGVMGDCPFCFSTLVIEVPGMAEVLDDEQTAAA